MADIVVGEGGTPEEVKKGLKLLDELVLKNKTFDASVFSDKCGPFVEETYKSLGSGNSCLLKSQVKKFVGCISSAYRGSECLQVTPESGKRAGETLDTCSWKGSMNRAWEIAKLIRCD